MITIFFVDLILLCFAFCCLIWCSYNFSCNHILFFSAYADINIYSTTAVSFLLAGLDSYWLVFQPTQGIVLSLSEYCSCCREVIRCISLNIYYRYCGIAPTILAGRMDPLLFEALYVSGKASRRTLLSIYSSFLFNGILCIILFHYGIYYINCTFYIFELVLFLNYVSQVTQHAIFLFARIPQIYENFKVCSCLRVVIFRRRKKSSHVMPFCCIWKRCVCI